MRFGKWMSTRAVLLLVILATPLGAFGQQSRTQQQSGAPHYKLVDIGTFGGGAKGVSDHPQRLRYRVIDVGTFGGATSLTNASRIENNAGTVAGEADTDQPCPYSGGFSIVISPAFRWRDGNLENIGLLPGGCFSLPNGINASGDIVGSSDNGLLDPLTGLPEIRADFRHNGNVLNLGTFGGANSLAADINDHGTAVGGAENTELDPFNFGGVLLGLPSPTAWRAFRWNGGKIRDIGTLGGPDAFAVIVNKYDEISGVSFVDDTRNPTTDYPTVGAFFWKNGKMQDVGTLGGVFTGMTYLNDRGEVFGSSDLADDLEAHAYVWSLQRGITDLGVLGGTFSNANWANNYGDIVGGSTTANNDAFHAVRWRNGVIEDLGTGPNTCSNAFQVNERGEIAGQGFNCDNSGVPHALLWERDGPALDLNDFLPPNSNLLLAETHFINDRGQIVAVALLPDGSPHIAILVPCDYDEPEGCRTARVERAGPAQAANASEGRRRLTPEVLAEIRSRATHKFRGFTATSPSAGPRTNVH